MKSGWWVPFFSIFYVFLNSKTLSSWFLSIAFLLNQVFQKPSKRTKCRKKILKSKSPKKKPFVKNRALFQKSKTGCFSFERGLLKEGAPSFKSRARAKALFFLDGVRVAPFLFSKKRRGRGVFLLNRPGLHPFPFLCKKRKKRWRGATF